MAQFCDRCKHDHEYQITMNADVACKIIANSMAFNVDEDEYPDEWIVDDDGLSNARCTKFELYKGD